MKNKHPIKATSLAHCDDWAGELKELIKKRLSLYFRLSDDLVSTFKEDNKFHCAGVEELENLAYEENLVAVVALIPHLQPAFYDRIIQEFLPNGGAIIEMGG